MTPAELNKLDPKNQNGSPANQTPAPTNTPIPSDPIDPAQEANETPAAESNEPAGTDQTEGETPDASKITPEYVKSLEDQVQKFEDVNGKLMDLVDSSPELMEVIRGMLGGKKFRSAILSVMSPDDLTPKEGDTDYPDAMTAMNERQKTLDGKKQRESDIKTNADLSVKAIDDFKNKMNLSDDQLNSFIESVDGDVSDLLNGKITTAFLEKHWKAANHDSDVQNAADQGKIEGLNTNIEAKKQTKKDDGLPSLASSSDLPPVPAKKKSYIDNLADMEKKKKII